MQCGLGGVGGGDAVSWSVHRPAVQPQDGAAEAARDRDLAQSAPRTADRDDGVRTAYAENVAALTETCGDDDVGELVRGRGVISWQHCHDDAAGRLRSS